MDKNKKSKTIELHELKKGDTILTYVHRGDSKVKDGGKEVLTFDHLDGMYSYCTLPDGNVMHLSRSTPLRKVGEHYEIVFDKDA